MGSVNKVILIGNVGGDPDVRSMSNGGKVVSFSVATNETWTDKNSGERKDKTEWHKVVIWNEHIQKVAEKYIRKGSMVYIEGALQTRKWKDQSGNDKYTTEVVLQKFRGELTMLSSTRRDEDDGGDGYSSGGYPEDQGRGRASQKDDFSSNLDDEIPF